MLCNALHVFISTFSDILSVDDVYIVYYYCSLWMVYLMFMLDPCATVLVLMIMTSLGPSLSTGRHSSSLRYWSILSHTHCAINVWNCLTRTGAGKVPVAV